MCRLLLAVNQHIDKPLLNKFLFQSINKKNTPGLSNYLDADYHKDGYGFAYWNNKDSKWNYYKSDKLFSNDINVDSVIDNIINIQPEILVGHLRNKGRCEGEININNTHPFIYNNYLLAHNGFIKNFASYKSKILDFIGAKYIDEIKGQTDTEHLFYLLLTFIDRFKIDRLEEGYTDCQIAFYSFINLFEFLFNRDIELVGNFIFSNGQFVMVIRYIGPNFKSSNEPPSLYYNDNNKNLISSEPVTNNCKIFSSNSYLIIN